MASLVSASDTAVLTGAANDLFDTFKRNIVIHKEPLKVVKQAGANVYVGYTETNSVNDYDYQAVSGVYSAMITYKSLNALMINQITELNTIAPNNQVKIKVKEDAKDFIQIGKTESVYVDGIHYNIATEPITQNYLGLIFYLYELKSIL